MHESYFFHIIVSVFKFKMNMDGKKSLFYLLLICTLTILPFLGLTDYHTKGEPREAIVAYSMLETGNWILPENNGGDIAYKPPFFHWMITAFSAISGSVTEYTSRLPSALALIVMTLVTFLFYRKRSGKEVAFFSALILLSNFEVHRAAFACRVDMVLTVFIVLALYGLYQWYEKGLKGFPWLATLFMGCATLTKGPVGILLPCLVTGVFLLMRGINFWKAFSRMCVVAVVSCIFPLIWYVAAYQQGGDNFISLVLEENLGRFMGKMSYESHENGIHYYFIMLAAGLLPYTLLLLFDLFSIKLSKPVVRLKAWWNQLCQMDPVRLFSLLSIVVIFVFYCIPKSKRSVYLLPIFPFIAYFLAEWIIALYNQRNKVLKIFSVVICLLGGLLTLVFGVVRMGWIPESIFGGKHAAENIAYLHALESMPMGIGGIVLILLPLILAIYLFVGPLKKKDFRAMTYTVVAAVFSIFLALDGVLQPSILNVKSDKRLAKDVMEFVPEGNLYSYIKADMMRYFTINFYCGNRVLLFESEKPEEGYLLIGKKDADNYLPQQSLYRFEQVYESDKRSCDTRDRVRLYRFKKNN